MSTSASMSGTLMSPGEWQRRTAERLGALGYAGFTFGPGVRWWPIEYITGRKIAGPFTSCDEFDTWLTQEEAKRD